MKINIKNIKGSMSIEILVAVTIITMAILSAAAVANKSVSIARQSTHYSQASFLLEEGAEAVRSMRDDSWTNLSSATTGATYYLLFNNNSWSLTSDINLATATGVFTRSVVFSSVNRDSVTGDIVASGGSLDSGTLLASINIEWPEGGVTKNKELSFYITDLF